MPFQLDPLVVALLVLVCVSALVLVGLVLRASRRAVEARARDAGLRERELFSPPVRRFG